MTRTKQCLVSEVLLHVALPAAAGVRGPQIFLNFGIRRRLLLLLLQFSLLLLLMLLVLFLLLLFFSKFVEETVE